MVRRSLVEARFLTGTILVLGLLTFLIFRPFLDWVILGFLFSYMFFGPYRGLLRAVKRRGIAAGVMLIGILLIFFLPLFFILSVLVRDVTEFASGLATVDVEGVIAGFLESFLTGLGVQADPESLHQTAADLATAGRSQLADWLRDFAASLLGLVFNVLVGLFIFGFTVYYGFVDGERFVRAVRGMIPLREPEKNLLMNEIRSVTNAVFIGHLLIALIQALLGTVGFLILGVADSFFWGFVMLILAIIPIVGPFLVWLPIGLYLLFSDQPVGGVFSSNPAFAGLGILLVVGPIVSTIDNVLRPKLIGSRADVHPFLILIGALGGLFVLGFTGFIVGPLVLALFVATLRVYRQHWSPRADRGPRARATRPLKKRSRSAT